MTLASIGKILTRFALFGALLAAPALRAKPVPPARPAAKIVSVKCLAGLKVDVHFVIDSPAGIASYKVWSTWGGGPQSEQAFAAPLPNHIDKTLTMFHDHPDSVDRDHQWGLRVEIPGAAAPILTYGLEPGPSGGKHRCPGHWLPPAVKK